MGTLPGKKDMSIHGVGPLLKALIAHDFLPMPPSSQNDKKTPRSRSPLPRRFENVHKLLLLRARKRPDVRLIFPSCREWYWRVWCQLG